MTKRFDDIKRKKAGETTEAPTITAHSPRPLFNLRSSPPKHKEMSGFSVSRPAIKSEPSMTSRRQVGEAGVSLITRSKEEYFSSLSSHETHAAHLSNGIKTNPPRAWSCRVILKIAKQAEQKAICPSGLIFRFRRRRDREDTLSLFRYSPFFSYARLF